MDKSESHDTAKLIGAALIGLAVGVGLGILFAPEKGSEMRKKIFGNLDDLFADTETPTNEKGTEDPEKDHPV